MKRLAGVISAIAFGLLVAWFFGYVTSRINWPRPKGPVHGCYEIDHCYVPWWVIAAFFSWFFGPAIVYGGVAFVGFSRKWSVARWIGTFSALFILTGCLYFAWYGFNILR